MSDDRYDVVWPRGTKRVERQALAPRLASLEGRTVALLWNHVFRGDEILPVVERELRARYPGLTVLSWDTFGSIYGAEERRTIAALPERLHELAVDGVISAVGC
jgi:hypothetical protein